MCQTIQSSEQLYGVENYHLHYADEINEINIVASVK
jgi:hypothetical protein